MLYHHVIITARLMDSGTVTSLSFVDFALKCDVFFACFVLNCLVAAFDMLFCFCLRLFVTVFKLLAILFSPCVMKHQLCGYVCIMISDK